MFENYMCTVNLNFTILKGNYYSPEFSFLKLIVTSNNETTRDFLSKNHLGISYMNTYTDLDLTTNKTIRPFLDNRYTIELEAGVTKKTNFFVHKGCLCTTRRTAVINQEIEGLKFLRMGQPVEQIVKSHDSVIYKGYFRLNNFQLKVERE